MPATNTVSLCVQLWPRATTDSERRRIIRHLRDTAPAGSAERECWSRALRRWSKVEA